MLSKLMLAAVTVISTFQPYFMLVNKCMSLLSVSYCDQSDDIQRLKELFNLFLEPTYLQNENLRGRCSISRKCGNKLQKPIIYLVLGGTELF